MTVLPKVKSTVPLVPATEQSTEYMSEPVMGWAVGNAATSLLNMVVGRALRV